MLGATTCSVCIHGKYSTGVASSSCLLCSQGNICENCSREETVVLLLDGCSKVCYPGEYFDSVSGGCKECPAGLVSQYSGTACSLCPKGEKYVNSTTCSTSCPTGMRETYIESKLCSGCAICEQCPAGTFGVSNSEVQCLICGKGTSSGPGSSACFNCTAQDECAPCEPGSYPVINDTFLECKECEAGKYMPTYDGGWHACIQCQSGSYSLAGSSTCTDCKSSCNSSNYIKIEDCNTIHDIVCAQFQRDLPFSVKIVLAILPAVIGITLHVFHDIQSGASYFKSAMVQNPASGQTNANYAANIEFRIPQLSISVTVSSTLFGSRFCDLDTPLTETSMTQPGLFSWDYNGASTSNVSETEYKPEQGNVILGAESTESHAFFHSSSDILSDFTHDGDIENNDTTREVKSSGQRLSPVPLSLCADHLMSKPDGSDCCPSVTCPVPASMSCPSEQNKFEIMNIRTLYSGESARNCVDGEPEEMVPKIMNQHSSSNILPAVIVSNESAEITANSNQYSGDHSARQGPAGTDISDSKQGWFGIKDSVRLQSSMLMMDITSSASLLCIINYDAPYSIFYLQVIALIWPACSDSLVFFDNFFKKGMSGFTVQHWVEHFFRRLLLIPDQSDSEKKIILSTTSRLIGEYGLSFAVQGQLFYFQLKSHECSIINQVPSKNVFFKKK